MSPPVPALQYIGLSYWIFFLVQFYPLLSYLLWPQVRGKGLIWFPIPMREMTGVIPLSLIPHSVDYIQLVLNSPIVAFKLVVEAILLSNYIR